MKDYHNNPAIRARQPKGEVPKVLFVQDPLSGKHYNMLPMFELMHEHWYCLDGPTDMARRIQEVLDYLCTRVLVETTQPCQYSLHQINDLNMILIHIRKAFEDMTNV